MTLNARLTRLEQATPQAQAIWWDCVELAAAEVEGREAAPGVAERVNVAIASGKLAWLEDLMA